MDNEGRRSGIRVGRRDAMDNEGRRSGIKVGGGTAMDSFNMISTQDIH